MPDGDVTFRCARPADEEAILELLTETFGRWPGVDIDVPPIDHLRWKLAGGPSELQCVVADGDSIAGGRIVLAQRMLLQGRPIESCSFVDVMVHPGYRERGVMKVIWETSLATGASAFQMTVGIAANPYVQRYMRATGMRPIANTIELLEHDGSSIEHYAPTGMTIALATCFDAGWEDFLAEASKPFDFIVERSVPYLNWRYADERAGRFSIITAKDGGRPLGYAIVTTSRGKAFIADMLVLPGRDDVLRALLSCAIERVGAAGVTSLRCWSPRHHRYRDSLIRAGLRPKRAVDRLLVMPFGEADLDSLFEREQLTVHFCIGDTDLV